MTERSETHRKLDAFSQHLLDACRFVLVSPSLSANIGSAVRALTTMGIPDLVVAAPRDAAFREDAGALALAAGAEARLAQVGSRPGLDAALADCQLAVAVSAEGREFGPPPAFPGPLCAPVGVTSPLARACAASRSSTACRSENATICTACARFSEL